MRVEDAGPSADGSTLSFSWSFLRPAVLAHFRRCRCRVLPCRQAVKSRFAMGRLLSASSSPAFTPPPPITIEQQCPSSPFSYPPSITTEQQQCLVYIIYSTMSAWSRPHGVAELDRAKHVAVVDMRSDQCCPDSEWQQQRLVGVDVGVNVPKQYVLSSKYNGVSITALQDIHVALSNTAGDWQ
jgi:hypothetical protein